MSRCIFLIAILVAELLFGSSAVAQSNLNLNLNLNKLRVVIPPVEKLSDVHATYFPKLLRLALSKTEATDGAFELEEFSQNFNGARFISELKRHGVVDVIWAVNSPQLDQDLLAIRIPILKSLNEYRIFLIRAEDQPKFNRVKQLNDLRQFYAGQGANWGDTQYFLDNDLPIMTTPQFDLLFTMLIGKRIDYFPRGLDEIWSDAEKFSDKGLVIEKKLMLHYKADKFFFVAKDNIALANRIERGLKLAQADGSFDELFNSIPGYQRGLNEIQSNKRLVFNLTTK